MSLRHGPALPWLTVTILVAAYAVSFLDRQVIGLLVEPVKADLHITDTQIGILQGPAFGIFYAALGLPLGWLADRVDRVVLIATAIAAWSAMTIVCGLADTFTLLLIGRIGVGIGEAALVPAAVSLIAGLFPPERRALPMSVFTGGLSIGVGLALVLGGTFIGLANHGLADWPIIGPWLAAKRPWQIVFILAGLSGLPIAGLVLLLPRRQVHAGRAAAAGESATGAATHLRRHSALFLPMLLGTTLLYIQSSAFPAWMPSLFVRRFDWAPAQVGQILGPFIMITALSGNIASGLLSTWFARCGRNDAPLRTMCIGGSLLLPFAVMAPLAGAPAVTIAATLAIYFTTALTFGVATTAFVAVTPAHLRGRVTGFYLLLGNLVGLGVGPLLVGSLMDHGPTLLRAISPALAASSVLVCTPAVISLWVARRHFGPLAQRQVRAR